MIATNSISKLGNSPVPKLELNGVVSLTFPDSLSGLEYQAFFSDNGTPSFANGNVTAVPFEPEANLAIFLLLGDFGLRKLKRKFS